MGSMAMITGRKLIKRINGAINIIVLTVIVALSAFAVYALWDSKQIYHEADKSHYAVYKPSEKDGGKSFKELQALNVEVFAWLSVYGTNIDYPVTQGQDNMKYVNTSAEGLYSLSGTIFLDYSNKKDFSDFNNILYGHHMEKKAMFGEIGNFKDINIFSTRQYGNLYFDGEDHGIEFFAFIHTDAYDNTIFNPQMRDGDRQEYLDNLLGKAIHKRDIVITVTDNIILLTTCSSTSTNGRDILAGRITGEIYEDQTMNMKINNKNGVNQEDQSGFVNEIYILPLLLILIIMVLLISRMLVIYHKSKKERNEKNE